MSEKTKTPTLSRREVAGLAAGAAALAASPALAAQPHMVNALAYCEAGLVELRKAKSNKGGHRKTAIDTSRTCHLPDQGRHRPRELSRPALSGVPAPPVSGGVVCPARATPGRDDAERPSVG